MTTMLSMLSTLLTDARNTEFPTLSLDFYTQNSKMTANKVVIGGKYSNSNPFDLQRLMLPPYFGIKIAYTIIDLRPQIKGGK